MPLHTQAASIKAWSDEQHVEHNRQLYREKFDAVINILAPELKLNKPAAGFYLWVATPIDDTEFAKGLLKHTNITVLPGSFLSREAHQINPGQGHVRIALVAPIDECIDAAKRIKNFIKTL
jgi:N-succinyldiaminopimelate aminotransferase